MRHIKLLAAIAGLLAAHIPAAPAAESGRAVLGNWGVETRYVDPAIKPGDDFYRHVNEGWLKSAKIPEGFASADSFLDASLNTEKQLEQLIGEIVASNPAPGSDEQLIKAFYQSYVDVPRLNGLGLTPIKDDLASILAIDSYDEVAQWMGRPLTSSIVGAGVTLDPGQPRRYVVSMAQSGLGLPSREYYVLPSEPFVGHRAAYRDYIENTFKRAGIDKARGRANSILALETAIAALQWTTTEQRDPVRMYHLMKVAELDAFAPGFNWTAFLAEAGYGDQTEIVVETDTAVQQLAALFAATPLEQWRSYLAFHYIDSFSGVLSAEWQQAHFDFYSRRLRGIEKPRPLQARAIEYVSSYVGEPLGRAYVKRYFPLEYRHKMDELVTNLRAAFRNRLDQNVWMDPATRKEALTKLDAVSSQIGYPDRWLDYSSVKLDAADLAGNVRALTEFGQADALDSLKGPRREWEWPYTPQTVNAGYSSDRNSITFPAAILQPPFFDPNADPAVNYGGAGAVIGHELGHAFDDQGSRSDAEGVLRNWWSDTARAEFEKRAAVLVEQYNAFAPVDGMHVNGALTLGENIGDLGGLTVAFDAYRLFVEKEQGGNAPVIDGFTGDQRFFLAWAQVWRSLDTPDALRQQLLSDPHSPGEFRTNGVVRNVEGWYAAFGIGEGDVLYLPPEKRAKIW